MMDMVLATVGLMALVMLVMSIGVIFKRPPLKGSCGGVGSGDCFCLNKAMASAAGKSSFTSPTVNSDGVSVYDGSQSP
jgi:hypothetical protein